MAAERALRGGRCASRGRSRSSIRNRSSRTSSRGWSAPRRPRDGRARAPRRARRSRRRGRARPGGRREPDRHDRDRHRPRRPGLAERHEGVYAALGIDPHQAGSAEAERVDELRGLLAHPRAVAVGEAGLDYHYGADRKPSSAGSSSANWRSQPSSGFPVVVHTRAANEDTEAILRGHPGTVVMHCFSEPGLLEAGLERGWYFSFAGNVTYPKAAELRDAAARVPMDRLLAETDSPYLAPQPVRGRTNEPAHVVHTVVVLAAARAVEADELSRRIDANATAAFVLT